MPALQVAANRLVSRISRGRIRRAHPGQILIIVAFSIVGLVAFMGLVVDTGLVFIGYGALRRSVDSAALAAAAQYRKDPNPAGLSKAALEFLVLNGVPNATAEVHVCNEDYPAFHDADLCTTPARRRLVRVDASTTVPLAFLPVVGIKTVALNATATSEAASLDIVLALDASESMTWDSPPEDLMRDPSECNAKRDPTDGTTSCHPFQEIQRAAMEFVDNLITDDNSYDRISIIPFHRTVYDDGAAYDAPIHLDAGAGMTPTEYRAFLEGAIADLSVYQASTSLGAGPGLDPYTPGIGSCLVESAEHVPCRYYIPDDQLMSINCGYDEVAHASTGGYDFSNTLCFTPVPAGSPIAGSFEDPNTGLRYERAYTLFVCDEATPGDRRYCGTSNIGGAFWASGQELVGKLGTHPDSFRQESLWVVILLTDGVANHTNPPYYCPAGENENRYWCQDYGPGKVDTRHCQPSDDPLYADFPALFNACHSAPPVGGGGTIDSSLYDADDFARDMAGYVALGQQALIFTIGYDTEGLLGHLSPGDDYGEQLLSYAADIGDDGKLNTVGLHPNYFYYDPSDISQSLTDIFSAITDQIATRISQ